jgi:hypothetical protein
MVTSEKHRTYVGSPSPSHASPLSKPPSPTVADSMQTNKTPLPSLSACCSGPQCPPARAHSGQAWANAPRRCADK